MEALEQYRESHETHLSTTAVQVGPLVGWLVGLVGAFVVGSEVGVCVVVVTVTPEICSAVGTGTVTPCAELALETQRQMILE